MTFISVYYFLSAKMKLEKVENLVANLHDKTEYATHIRNLKQALNHEFVLKKVHKIIKFKQKNLVKIMLYDLYIINMSKDLQKKV